MDSIFSFRCYQKTPKPTPKVSCTCPTPRSSLCQGAARPRRATATASGVPSPAGCDADGRLLHRQPRGRSPLSVRLSVRLSAACEKPHVFLRRGAPVRINQLSQGKPSEMMKFGLSLATRPQSFHCQHRDGQTCRLSVGWQAAARSSRDKTTATSPSAANHLTAKRGLQSPLELTSQPGAGQGLFPTPPDARTRRIPRRDAWL